MEAGPETIIFANGKDKNRARNMYFGCCALKGSRLIWPARDALCPMPWKNSTKVGWAAY